MKTWTDKKLQEAVKASTSMMSVLAKLGIRPGGGSFKVIKSHVKRLLLDTTHFVPYGIGNRSKLRPEDVLIEDSSIHGPSLRRMILREKVIEYKCEICGNDGTHMNAPLSLQLDHINGVHSDNRVTNLRFLCPNCHSQTPTFAKIKGKKNLEKIVRIETCDFCCTEFNRKKFTKSKNKFCSPLCARKFVSQQNKARREAIKLRFEEVKNYTKVGIEFGISANMVKRCCELKNFDNLTV